MIPAETTAAESFLSELRGLVRARFTGSLSYKELDNLRIEPLASGADF
jgi:hypothetical protein